MPHDLVGGQAGRLAARGLDQACVVADRGRGRVPSKTRLDDGNTTRTPAATSRLAGVIVPVTLTASAAREKRWQSSIEVTAAQMQAAVTPAGIGQVAAAAAR